MSQDFHLNRVSMDESVGSESSPAGARPKNKKSYDLTSADMFWQKHKGRFVFAMQHFSSKMKAVTHFVKHYNTFTTVPSSPNSTTTYLVHVYVYSG